MCNIELVLDTLTKTECEALKAIYRIVDAATGDAGPEGAEAHTGDVADRMGVAPATVTATVKRLADRGDRKSTRLNSSHT